MKITIDCRMYTASGIGRYLQMLLPDIISYFLKKEVTVSLLGNPVELRQFSGSGVEILDFSVPIYSIKEQCAYKSLVGVCDLFWSPHFNVPLFSLKAKKRLVTIHDVYHLAYYQELSLKQKCYASFVYRAAVNKSDAIISVSDFSRKEIIKYLGSKMENKIKVIYNGIETFSFSTPSQKSESYGSYFLFVGNVKPHKNLWIAVLAFKQVLENNPSHRDTKFLIVGKKDGFITGDTQLFDFINNDDLLNTHVHFTGLVSDASLMDLYQNAIAFLFPSKYEGFGFPPLEAMALGCPVISSNAACMPEILSEAVLYFNPDSFEELAAEMLMIIRDDALRYKLIEEGKKRASLFKWDSSISKHISLIESLIY